MSWEMFLLWLISAAIAALGLFLLGFAGELALRGAASDTGIYLGVSALCFYPAYLLGRSAVRIRREQAANPPTADEEKLRRKGIDAVLIYSVVGILGVLFSPLPTEVKVISVIISLAVGALLIAMDEPPKKRTKHS